MKKLSLFIIITLFSVSLFAGKNVNEYSLPKEVRFKTLAENYNKPDETIIKRLFPIGWSKSGHFAYITVQFEDAQDSYLVAFSINDLINDSVVALLYADISSEEAEEGNIVQLFWGEKRMDIQKILKVHNIVAGGSVPLEFPLFYKNKEYTVEIKEQCLKEQVYGINKSKNINVVVAASNGKKKRVFEKAEGFCKRASALGYIKSPFEPRIVIILGSYTPGWEGPPSVVDFHLIGSHLNVGFK